MGGRGSSSGRGNAKNSAGLKALNALNSDSTRAEIREALDSLKNGDTVYGMHYGSDGVSYSKITKNSDDGFTVNGRRIEKSDVVRNLYGNGHAEYVTKEPDMSSHVKVTGKNSETVGGVKYKSGTYDTLLYSTDPKKIRKVEQKGKIATYDGAQYGVTKTGGKYITTHIPTGIVADRTATTMKEVSENIRKAHEKFVKGKDFRKDEYRLQHTLRGD